MTHAALSGGGSRSPFPGSAIIKMAEPTINATQFCAASDAPAAPTGISTMNAIGIGIGVMLIILNICPQIAPQIVPAVQQVLHALPATLAMAPGALLGDAGEYVNPTARQAAAGLGRIVVREPALGSACMGICRSRCGAGGSESWEPDRGHDTSGGTPAGASGADSGGACGGCG